MKTLPLCAVLSFVLLLVSFLPSWGDGPDALGEPAKRQPPAPDRQANATDVTAPDRVPRPIPDWVHDVLVVVCPAAAVGGCQAGNYTPAVNGVRPWRRAAIRWLTGRHVMGNTAVLVRQEGSDGGACLSAIVDPGADYVFEVVAFVPDGRGFGERTDEEVDLRATVLGADEAVIAEVSVRQTAGDWKLVRVPFHSGEAREVRCVVHACSPGRLPCVYYVENFRLTRADRWWVPQNVFNEARTAVRLPDQRPTLCATLDPDLVSGFNGPYLNWDGFFTRRGIAVGGGAWEQEYNHLSVDDPAVARFLDDGMMRDVEGRISSKAGLWPGYDMCHNAPGWHTYQQQRLARIAPEVQALVQDNICAPSFEQSGRGCFCRACREEFRRRLREHWTPAQLSAAGITNLSAFDIAEYVRTAAAGRVQEGRDAVLADPVLRAFIQFHYASQLDRWRDTVATLKRAAGRPVAVYGNQWGAGGRRPYSVALSQVGDVVCVEVGTGAYTSQNRAQDALSVKLGAAAGEYRRPVWLGLTSLFHTAHAARSSQRLSTAQIWADGGVPTCWATAPGVSGWFYDAEARLRRFAQRHRTLLARRQRHANVGLVFSLPTHAWRKFRAFNLSPAPYVQWFGRWAQVLEETHVPYEAVCWSHPLLGSDAVSLARLNRYQVLVLPGVDCFTDAQREAVRAFQARGGRVITMSGQLPHDGDAVPRPAGETLAAKGDRLVEVDPIWMTRYGRTDAQRSEEAAREVEAAATHLAKVVRRALADDSLLKTDAPSTVWANLWMDDTRQVLALHLVNGDIDLQADRLQPVRPSRWRVRLPEGLSVERAVAISPDGPDEKHEVAPLPIEVTGGWAEVVVPRLESYTIVAMFAGEALAASADLANARRAVWRAGLIRGRADPALDDRLHDTLATLRAGRLDAGAPAAAEVARAGAAALDDLLKTAAP